MKKKSLASLVLAMFILASVSGVYAAEGVSITPFWSNTVSISVTLGFNGTTANCNTTIIGMSGTTRVCGSMALYVKDGSQWVYVTRWEGDVKSDALTIGNSYSSCKSKSVYKLVVDAEVYRNGSWEYITVSSAEKTCP